MTKRILRVCLALLCIVTNALAQSTLRRNINTSQIQTEGEHTPAFGDEQHGSNRLTWGRDTSKTEKSVPIGIFQWKLDNRLGTVVPAENNDTVVKHYSNFNNTDGYNGEYSYLGNLGSARLSRIFMNRTEDQPFFFLQPLSYALTPMSEFLFSNTLSPLTNLSYHSSGNRQTGEDRVRAYFASNINKVSGIGFKIDYLYGRGYYNSSQSSIFNSNLFGYYRGERYSLHAWTNFGHHKNAESGGIEDDKYIRNPQSFPQKYGSKDIPTMLDQTFNRNDFQTYYLTHRYNLGYYKEVEIPDSLKPKKPTEKEFLLQVSDSLRMVLAEDSVQRKQVLDSLSTAWQQQLVTPKEFIPVSGLIHTLQIDHLNHTHYGYDTPENYYSNHYYGDRNDISDKTKALVVRNTLGLSMQEGFKKWVKMGLTLFATHQYERYHLPYLSAGEMAGFEKYTSNNVYVGAEISKTEGELLHYNASGEISLVGDDIGEFTIEGSGDLNFRLGRKDTIQLEVEGHIKNVRPDFYLENYHSQSAWWDKPLDMEKRIRLAGTLTNKRSRTSLTAGVENMTKYTYLAMNKLLQTNADASSTQPTAYSHAVQVNQANHNIQVFSATLKQDLKWGPLNWENEFTYQASSDQDKLPLPAFNAYSNLYLLFRIAKVLRVELGADARYFTRYYAPDYAPNIGQFAVQDKEHPRVSIGNYPIVNAYVNLHLKRCRIYVKANHVNAGTGNMFLVPHHPINPLNIHWGVSWNFFN